MALFFERMQRATRFYETNAPAYLRTHPLTYERIADMQSRAQNLAYRQVPDSLEFQLMRAKIKAAQDNPQEALAFFEESLGEKKYLSEAASRYGLVAALIRVKAYARAGKELQTLRKSLPDNPAVQTLAGRYYVAIGDEAAALQTLPRLAEEPSRLSRARLRLRGSAAGEPAAGRSVETRREPAAILGVR